MSNATIDIPFALGEMLWASGHERQGRDVTCPECCGTKVLEVIKGNGEKLSIECNFCQEGYYPATGKVTEYVTCYEPIPFLPRRVQMSGDEFTYSESLPSATSYSYRYAKELFRDRDECAKRCAELAEEAASNEANRVIANLESKRRSLAFSSHYWTRKVKDLRRDLAAAEARLAVCKVKPSPTGGDTGDK